MTVKEIFEKGKIANIRKMTDYGKCEMCGKKIEVEDEEVGFCGTADEWNEYTSNYDHITLDEELDNVVETETEVKADSYYENTSDTPLEAEWNHIYKNRAYVFCFQECYDDFLDKTME